MITFLVDRERSSVENSQKNTKASLELIYCGIQSAVLNATMWMKRSNLSKINGVPGAFIRLTINWLTSTLLYDETNTAAQIALSKLLIALNAIPRWYEQISQLFEFKQTFANAIINSIYCPTCATISKIKKKCYKSLGIVKKKGEEETRAERHERMWMRMKDLVDTIDKRYPEKELDSTQ